LRDERLEKRLLDIMVILKLLYHECPDLYFWVDQKVHIQLKDDEDNGAQQGGPFFCHKFR